MIRTYGLLQCIRCNAMRCAALLTTEHDDERKTKSQRSTFPLVNLEEAPNTVIWHVRKCCQLRISDLAVQVLNLCTRLLCWCCLIQALRLAGVSGHGRLMNPPARNSMWRFGFPNPVNYNDNELFCGGHAGEFECL